MSTKKGKPKLTKSKAEQCYVREQLKSTGKPQGELAEIARVNQSNISKFMAGKTNLSDMAIETLYESGTVKRPEPHELVKDAQNAPPMDSYDGISLTTAEAAEEKGVSQATIRRWCKTGKLNYTRAGRKIMVAWDEKYKEVEPTELGKLRARVRELEETVADQDVHIQHLEQKVTQLVFGFDQPSDSNQMADNDHPDGEQNPPAGEQNPEQTEGQAIHDSDYYNVATCEQGNTIPDIRMAPKYSLEHGNVIWPVHKLNGKVTTGRVQFSADRLASVKIDHFRRLVILPESLAEKL